MLDKVNSESDIETFYVFCKFLGLGLALSLFAGLITQSFLNALLVFIAYFFVLVLVPMTLFLIVFLIICLEYLANVIAYQIETSSLTLGIGRVIRSFFQKIFQKIGNLFEKLEDLNKRLELKTKELRRRKKDV